MSTAQTNAAKHILTYWSLLLVCIGWALSLGWWFVTHSLCTLRLVPNLSLQTLPLNQHPVPSVTLPLPPFSLPFLRYSVSHWGEALMLTGNRMCSGLYVCTFFLVDTLDKLLLWSGYAESWYCAVVEFVGCIYRSHNAVWLNKTEWSYISSKCCHAHRHFIVHQGEETQLGILSVLFQM